MLVMGAFCVTGGAIKMAPDDDEIENDHRIKVHSIIFANNY